MAETNRYEIKQGADDPQVEGTLRQADDSPVPMAIGTEVRFVMSQVGGTKRVDGAATVTDGEAGTVEYAWGATDTDTPGAFRAEFWVTLPSGKVRKIPNDGYIDVMILATL